MEYVYSDNHFHHPNLLTKEPARITLLAQMIKQPDRRLSQGIADAALLLPYRKTEIKSLLSIFEQLKDSDNLEHLLQQIITHEPLCLLISELQDCLMFYQLHRTIKAQDTLYYLGDFAMQLKPQLTLELFNNLFAQDNVVFVRGNHDDKSFINKLKTNDHVDIHMAADTIKRQHTRWYLSHYPMICNNYPQNTHKNVAANFHGHTHGAYNHPDCLDVSFESILSFGFDQPAGVPYKLSDLVNYNQQFNRQ